MTKLSLLLVLALWPVFTLWPPSLRAGSAPRPDLSGHAADPAGAALEKVRVLILAAGPRQGSSPLCPYNYPDCGKETSSDARGDFRLPSLDPAMDFCVLALAPGYEPCIRSKIRPEAGPLNLELRPRNLAEARPERHVAGRIIGPDGAPVAGAMIDVGGVEIKDTTRWGGNDITDGMTVSDASGEFHLVGRKDFTAVRALLSAPGLARRWARIEPGKTCLLRLRSGGTVAGRLVRDGQGLGGVWLGLCTEERECGKYLNGPEVATDEAGRFVFRNVPAGLKFQLFGKMDSLRAAGAACRRDFVSPPDGATDGLGDWQVAAACRLQGRVILADGKGLPADTRLMIDRKAAWDNTLVPLDAEGNFDVPGVPAEQVGLSVEVAGYRLSRQNPNLDLSNPRGLVGRVTGDTLALNILLEPGNPPDWSDIVLPSCDEMQKAEQMPLRGVQ